MHNQSDLRSVWTWEKDVPVADTEATITVAGVLRDFWNLRLLFAGYDKAPAAAELLTVAIGGNTLWTGYVSTAGIKPFYFGAGINRGANNKNEDLVISLGADSAGAKGVVNIGYQ